MKTVIRARAKLALTSGPVRSSARRGGGLRGDGGGGGGGWVNGWKRGRMQG